MTFSTKWFFLLGAIAVAGCGESTDSDASDAGSDAVAVTCPEPTGGPTVHDTTLIDADETWSANASPHDVPFDTTIAEGSTLTIEPCATVRIGAGKTVTVLGRIEAPGRASEPIEIGALDDEPWATMRSYGGPMSFSWTTIADGGDPLNIVLESVAMVDVRGSDQSMPTQEVLHVDHVTLRNSASQGIMLREGGGFTRDSEALTVTGGAAAPINIWARAVGTIPAGSYTGNADDVIVLPGSGGYSAIVEDTTMHARGVPYRIGTPGTSGTLVVGDGLDGSVATLTIEPGVTLRFMKDGIFHVEIFAGTSPASGALIAVGTPSEPIVFTSDEATPAAGDWLGIYFGSAPDPANRMENTEVRYAGGLSGTGSFSCTNPISDGRSEAAIRILGAPPAGAFVTNSLIADSAGYGFDRGWTGDDSIDFTASNTFTNLAWCPQTSPIPPSVGCAGVTVACP